MATVYHLRGTHPCFSPGVRKSVGRLHLPVAPRATARVRFDTGPVRAQEALTPLQALALLDSVLAEGTELGMVGITGPGDPMAVPEATLETLRLVRNKYPDLPLCVTANGLGAAQHAEALADLGISHATVLVDAVDPKVVQMIYAWIRPGTRNLPLPEAAELLVAEQARAIEALADAGIPVKANTTVYRGCNENHVGNIARDVAEHGATIMAVVPYRAGVGAEDYLNMQPCMDVMREVRTVAAHFIELMPQEDVCGHDLVGLARPEPDAVELAGFGGSLPKPSGRRVNVAVASSDGMSVDLHLGQTQKFLIYGPREDGLPCLLGMRTAPPAVGGSSRWEELALVLSDCFAVLVSGAGEPPRKVLGDHGIRVLITDADAEGAVDVLYGGGKKGKGKGKGR